MDVLHSGSYLRRATGRLSYQGERARPPHDSKQGRQTFSVALYIFIFLG
jgi:hypothetical protein